MEEQFDPLRVMLSAFALAAVGGLAGLLHSTKKLTKKAVVAAVLYSGMTGITIALIWYNKYREEGNIYFLLGVSAAGGLGGVSIFDLWRTVQENGGFSLRIGSNKNGQNGKGEQPGGEG
jgi:hypothetical protein